MKYPAIYIVTNKKNGMLYVGVISDLIKRIYEHKNHFIDGFTKKYNCTLLVYYEYHSTMELAIAREKRIKGGSRSAKINLIESKNFIWNDLYSELF